MTDNNSKLCPSLWVSNRWWTSSQFDFMWINYDQPVITKEINGTKVMLYRSCGIPNKNIAYQTEFINKTKELYLNVNGGHKDETIGFENNINIHLLIDTDVYRGYSVNIKDGMVTIILYEIVNQKPAMIDLTNEIGEE